MKVELFWPWGLSSPISPSLHCFALEARKLLRDYGYPFSLFIFIRALYPHKSDQMKCLPAFSTDSLRSSSSVWALFVEAGVFFPPQYPEEHMVIKTINAAFLRFFLLAVNYDNGIHTQMHAGFSSPGKPQNCIVLFRKQHISPKSQEATDLYNEINGHVCKRRPEATRQKNRRSCVCAMCW